jgi:glycine cleavage system H protein
MSAARMPHSDDGRDESTGRPGEIRHAHQNAGAAEPARESVMTVLLVVLTIAVFLTVDWLLHRGKMPVAATRATSPAVRLPSGVFFARSHTWLNLFPSGHAWLGVDDFVSRLLDQPALRFRVEPGTHVTRGEPLLELEEDGRTLTIRSPIDARVVGLNPVLASDPGTLQSAPFSDGWVCELIPDRHSDVKSMMLGAESQNWMQREFGRLRDLFAGAGGVLEPAMLQDGGPPVAGAMRQADEEIWQRFDREFLAVR